VRRLPTRRSALSHCASAAKMENKLNRLNQTAATAFLISFLNYPKAKFPVGNTVHSRLRAALWWTEIRAANSDQSQSQNCLFNLGMFTFIIHRHHQPINVPTAGAQAFLLEYT
jgi:hypothetical protein